MSKTNSPKYITSVTALKMTLTAIQECGHWSISPAEVVPAFISHYHDGSAM